MLFQLPATNPTVMARKASFSSIMKIPKSTCVALAMFPINQRARWSLQREIWRLERGPTLSTVKIVPVPVLPIVTRQAIKPLSKFAFWLYSLGNLTYDL